MNEKDMQHGLDWDASIDPTGWIASEKYDGCRAYWDGTTLWSRGGIAIQIPEAWRAALPASMPLDGEVYFGIHGQTKTTQAVRYGTFFDGMRYRVFDAPAVPGRWTDRIEAVKAIANDIVMPVWWIGTQSMADMKGLFVAVHEAGGEGLMLRHPELAYTPGRTDRLLKVKYAWQFETN